MGCGGSGDLRSGPKIGVNLQSSGTVSLTAWPYGVKSRTFVATLPNATDVMKTTATSARDERAHARLLLSCCISRRAYQPGSCSAANRLCEGTALTTGSFVRPRGEVSVCCSMRSVLLVAVGTALLCGDAVADEAATVPAAFRASVELADKDGAPHAIVTSKLACTTPAKCLEWTLDLGRADSVGLVALVDLLGEPTRVRDVPGQNTLVLELPGSAKLPAAFVRTSQLDAADTRWGALGRHLDRRRQAEGALAWRDRDDAGEGRRIRDTRRRGVGGDGARQATRARVRSDERAGADEQAPTICAGCTSPVRDQRRDISARVTVCADVPKRARVIGRR